MKRLLLGLILVSIPACGPRSPGGEPQPEMAIDVGDFRLTDSFGEPFGSDDLKGKVYVASFVFTRCTGGCPSISATVARLQSQLKNYDDVHFVTFTVDPEHDDAAELREYAESFRADPERWHFLTGTEDRIRGVMKRFMVSAERSREKDVDPGELYTHTTKLLVVGKRGRLRGLFDGNLPQDDRVGDFEANVKRLLARVEELRTED